MTTHAAPTGERSSLSRVIVVAGVGVVILGFVGGYLLGRAPSGGELEAVAPVTTTTEPAPVRSTTTVPPTTATTSTTLATTTAAPTTVTTLAPTTFPSTAPTTRPPVTAPLTFPPTAPPTPPPTAPPTEPPTVPPTEAPPPTVAPARIEVRYAKDAFGRLEVPRRGSAILSLVNTGGYATQYIVTGSGFSVPSNSPARSMGTLQPNELVVVRIAAPGATTPVGTTGTIEVLGTVNPSVPFVIV